jgi:hypothetical protein
VGADRDVVLVRGHRSSPLPDTTNGDTPGHRRPRCCAGELVTC